MKIDFTGSFNLQAKKYDWIRICYILQRCHEPITANQINYYFNRIFPQTYSCAQRIAQVIKQRKDIIKIKQIDNTLPKLYYFNGEVILSKSTRINWEKKSNHLF